LLQKSARTFAITAVPTIAVDKNGVVGVIWQDRLEDTAGNCQFLYFTYSKDGEQSFSKPIKISSEKSCPELGSMVGLA
jgi:hypothetical protein